MAELDGRVAPVTGAGVRVAAAAPRVRACEGARTPVARRDRRRGLGAGAARVPVDGGLAIEGD